MFGVCEAPVPESTTPPPRPLYLLRAVMSALVYPLSIVQTFLKISGLLKSTPLICRTALFYIHVNIWDVAEEKVFLGGQYALSP